MPPLNRVGEYTTAMDRAVGDSEEPYKYQGIEKGIALANSSLDRAISCSSLDLSLQVHTFQNG